MARTARTAEELIALKEKRENDDREKLREERRRATNRAKRRKLGDGDLMRQLGLTTQELRGLVLDARDPGTRKRWARMGSAREAIDEPSALPEAAE